MRAIFDRETVYRMNTEPTEPMNISDHYVDLLERVVEENKALREDIKNQGIEQSKIFQDFSSKLNQLKAGSSTSGDSSQLTTKRRRKQIDVPHLCRRAFRKMYTLSKKAGTITGFITSESYDAKENMDVVKKVIDAVEKDNGGQDKCPWSHAQLKGAGATYFKTRRDLKTRADKNKADDHRMICRRQGRMRDKLQRRLETLEKSNTDKKRQDKIKKALTLSYTSSDESDLSESEDGQLTLKGYLVKHLPWERSALRRVKDDLDKWYRAGLPLRSRRSVLPRRRHTTSSTRPVPDNPIGWAVREPVAPAPRQHSTPNTNSTINSSINDSL